MAAYLDARGDALSLADVAFTSQVGRDVMSERLAVVATSIGELRDKLTAFAASDDATVAPEKENQDLVALGQSWVNGDAVDWRLLHGDMPPRRISLPRSPVRRPGSCASRRR